MNVLVVVDMQNDFITGSLGSKAAQDIVVPVAERVASAHENGETVFFTLDTHDENYLSTQEGKNLPVAHCVPGTVGHELAPEIEAVAGDGIRVIKRDDFGCMELIKRLGRVCEGMGFIAGDGLNIEVCGLCTEICVIVNALTLKAALPEALISVNSRLTAALSQKGFDAALEVMRACQIKVV